MNNEAIKQKTNELAELLRNSDEHRIYLDAKTRAYGNESTRRLLDEYRILQTRVQAGTLAGADCREEMTKLQKMGELLQLDFAASEYLFAQYALNNVLGDIYRQLAAAVMQTLAFLKTDMHRIFECCPIFGHK